MKHGMTAGLIILFLIGLGCLLYPTASNLYNQNHNVKIISDYSGNVSSMTEEEKQSIREEAQSYNASLPNDVSRFIPTEESHEAYETALSVGENGVMAYLEIPKISVSLPIYHGTEEMVLQEAVGHLEGSSLPIGGTGTHAVLSAHRGLSKASLFTNLNQLEEGDIFQIRVLDETLYYQVDQIRIVLPEDLSELGIEKDKDYVTLLTCTPYAVNTHRLLVRGTRIDGTGIYDAASIVSEAVQTDPILVAVLLSIPLIVINACILMYHLNNRAQRKKIVLDMKKELRKIDRRIKN